jgi:hypothetical protein
LGWPPGCIPRRPARSPLKFDHYYGESHAPTSTSQAEATTTTTGPDSVGTRLPGWMQAVQLGPGAGVVHPLREEVGRPRALHRRAGLLLAEGEHVTTLRLEQIAEAMDDLESVFADPACFHSPGPIDDRPVQDYADSLASEFIGQYRDDSIVYRLRELIGAEDAGRPRDAMRHLKFVRRTLRRRLAEWGAGNAAKPLVADPPGSQGQPQTALTGESSSPVLVAV